MRFFFSVLPIFMGLVFNLAAATTAEYVFRLNIDENIRDLSGNSHTPETGMAENSWSLGDIEAIHFTKEDDYIKVPFGAFPGKRGSVEFKIFFDRLGGEQTLWQVYGSGDGIKLSLKDSTLIASYFHRADKKWYHAKVSDALMPGIWTRILLNYDLNNAMTVFIDGRKAVSKKIGEAAADFATGSVMYIGCSHDRGQVLRGKINYFRMTDENTLPKKISEGKNTAVKTVKEIKFELGSFRLTFNEANFSLLSLSGKNTEFASRLRQEPLWALKLYNLKSRRTETIVSEAKAEITYRKSDGELEIRWKGLNVPGGNGTFDIAALIKVLDAETLSWELNSSQVPEGWAFDTVSYPLIPCAPTSDNPEDMFLTYPYYYGRNQPDPFSFRSGESQRFENAYVEGAHFQFCYLYGKDKPGLYIETRDSEGYYKEYLFVSYPKQKTLTFTLTQVPEQRTVSRTFKSAYPVRTSLIDGDWYDAAKRYRTWAVKQRWCSNGPLYANKHVPEWCKNLDAAVRFNTRDNKKLKDNIKNAERLSGIVRSPALGIWYQYNGREDSSDSAGMKNKWMCAWNGRSDAVNFPGTAGAIKNLSSNYGYSFIGYINSRIYDQSLDPNHQESKEMQSLVMRDRDGSFQLYGKIAYEGCRACKAWQDHLIKIIEKDVAELGFRGMYLDSFGRGQPFCYSDKHGHPVASGNGSVKGQLEFARRLKEKMRVKNPDFILSGEASMEQFIDVIDVKLHHYNCFIHAVPVWHAVYHDYQLLYGRFIRDTPPIQSTAVFHLGAQIGRFLVDPQPPDFEKSYLGKGMGQYYQNLMTLRHKFRNFLVYGEMLRPPLIINPSQGGAMTTQRREKFLYPPIISSAWKSPEGKITIFFSNHLSQEVDFDFELKGQEFDAFREGDWTLYRYSADFKLGNEKFKGGKLTLAPLTTVAITLY